MRQGLLYRQMGASTLALSKFYAVMTSALTLKHGSMEYYQRLVLHAQTEIAETHYLQGQMGLIYERLQQPEKASFLYDRIKAREKELASEASPGLKTVVDMAKWRNEFLNWQTQARRFSQTNAQLQALPPLSATQ